jgi:hypothetical protein
MISHKPASAGAIQTMRLGRDVAADIKEFRLAESREGFDSFDQMGNWRIPGIDSQKKDQHYHEMMGKMSCPFIS